MPRRRLGDGSLGTGDAVAGQEVVVIGVRFEREGGPAGEGGDELVGRTRDLFLGLGHGHRLDLLGLEALRAERSRAPSIAASATSVQSRRMARIASSLAGMMKSSSSGSTLVSPVPTTGISSLLASVTPIRSRCGSTMKMAPGRRFILRMPPSVPWSLVISSVSLAASFLVIRSKSPLA